MGYFGLHAIISIGVLCITSTTLINALHPTISELGVDVDITVNELTLDVDIDKDASCLSTMPWGLSYLLNWLYSY
jgi:hypothetical protein